MKRVLPAILISLLAGPLWGVEGAAYLKGAEGVRSSGLAGAFGAAYGSAESLWYNPAGLSGLRGAEASFTHQSLDNAFDSDHLVAGAFLGWQHSFGLMYSRKGATDIRRDAFNTATGTFEVSNSVLGLGYAYDFSWLAIGIGAKMLDEKVEKLSGSSTAFDLGLQSKFDKEHALFGLSLQNLGSAPSLGGPAEVSLPTTLRTSLAWRAGEPAQSLTLFSDYRYLMSSSRGAFALAAEYAEAYDENTLALRLGWDFGQSALGGLSGLSLGAGFSYKFVGVDYAWLPLDVLGSSHRIALTLSYDQKTKEQDKAVAEYLGINPNAAVLPTPTPSPKKLAPVSDAHVGAELEALLAATPTPTPLPTPEVQAIKDKPKGIIGAIFSIFSFGKKDEASAEEKKPGGILKGFFSIFGMSSDEDKPVAAPDQPGQPTPGADDDSFVNPSAAPQGSASPQPTPTAKPTPVLQKMKGWLSF